MTSTLTPAEIAKLSHQTEIPAINASNAVCLAAAFIAVVLRFVSRRITKLKIQADDGLIAVALIFFTGYVAATAFATHYGLGKHIIFVTNAYGLTTSLIAVFCFYNVTLPFIKFSILCLYTRIFPQRWMRFTCIGVGAFIFSFSFAQLMLDIFECVPIRSQWDPTVKGHCVNETAVIRAGGVLNIVADFILYALPMPLLWNLQIPDHKKRLLSAIFLIGGSACIASIVRLVYASGVAGTDTTFSELGGLVTSTVEISVGIIAACIPTYKALVNIVFQRRVISSLGSHRFRSRREDGIELMNDTAESTKSNQSRVGWGKIKQETTISQIHQRSPDGDKGVFGVSNAIGNSQPSHVPELADRV